MKLLYRFTDPALYTQALTHRSAAAADNERLEFLGDALLNGLIAEAIFCHFPQATEGEMSRWRAALVCQETLADIARSLELGNALVLGSGELKSGGFRRDSILADALEALVAAIYLDSNFDSCRDAVMPWFADRLAALSPAHEQRDAKTRLQEWLQARHKALPVYELLDEQGASHERQFVMLCRIASPALEAQGRGSSRKQAEQQAAAHLIALLEARGEKP